MSAPEPSPAAVFPPHRLIVPLMGDPIGLWEGLRMAYLRVRPAVTAPDGTIYPVVTAGDIEPILATWERSIGRDYRADRDKEGVRDAWAVYVNALRTAVRGLSASSPFEGSAELWCVTSLRLARALSGMYRPPSTLSQHLESLPATVNRALNNAPRAALGALPMLVTGAAGGVADVVGGATSRAWRALGVPLLIGGLVIVGAVVIVPRILPAGRAARAVAS